MVSFPFRLNNFLSHYCSADLVAVDSLSFHISENVFTLPSFLQDFCHIDSE